MGFKIRFEKGKKKKLDFSKRIFNTISFFCALITFFTMAVIWKTSDTSPLAYLIPCWFAELATATGFYYNKAKAENLNKKYKEESDNGIYNE